MRVAVLALALIAAVSTQRAEAQDCRLVSFGEVPILHTSEGNVQLGATLNDRPVRLAFNLNSAYSLVSADKAKELNASIRTGEKALMGLGQATTSEIATLGTLNLGTAPIKKFEAFVVRGDQQGADFILGSNVLQDFLPEFDVSHNVIRLFSRQHCPDRLVYWSSDYMKIPYHRLMNTYLIDVKINDTDYHAAISPGIPRSIITEDAADHLDLPHQADGDILMQTLEFGGVKLHNLNVTDQLGVSIRTGAVVKFKPNATLGRHDLVIGDDVLKHLRFIIDFDAETVFFTVG